MARSREKNREKVKKAKEQETKQELLSRKNEYGNTDLTPYNAIRVMKGKEIAFR